MRRRRRGSPTLAVGYLRVSTDEQSLGLEAQRAACEAWASAQGITIASWHVDAGVSGGADLADRPGLGAALEALRQVGAGVLLVAKRDRLARDVSIAIAVERSAATLGAVVRTADGTGNGDTAADAFMRTLLDAAAQYERSLIRSRTKAALQIRRAQGKATNHAPWGYLAAEDGTLVPNPHEQAIAERARALRAEGLSFHRIRARLTAEGYTSRRGHPIAYDAVYKMVTGWRREAA